MESIIEDLENICAGNEFVTDKLSELKIKAEELQAKLIWEKIIGNVLQGKLNAYMRENDRLETILKEEK